MDLSGICGQVQGMQSKLLTLGRLDRMIGAKTPEEAFRVLLELQYAEYVDESTEAKDFSKIIESGLLETKKMILSGSGYHGAMDFVFRRFDLNNLKRALKLKLVQKESVIEDFSNNNGFSSLGYLTKSELEQVVFERKYDVNLPYQFIEALQQVDETYGKEANFRAVEFALDQAHFAHLYQVAMVDRSNEFLGDLFTFIVNSVNFRSCARSVLLLKETVPTEAWIPFGNLPLAEAQKVERVDDLIKFAQKNGFASAVSNIEDGSGEESEAINKIEKGVDQMYADFIDGQVQGEANSVQVPMVYFEKRLQNSRLLKFVMFAKFHGLSPDEIYKTLEKF